MTTAVTHPPVTVEQYRTDGTRLLYVLKGPPDEGGNTFLVEDSDGFQFHATRAKLLEMRMVTPGGEHDGD